MLLYGISKTQYAYDLNGTGAKLNGGRWNHIDTACIYASESRALATLEFSVNVSDDLIPRALIICIFEVDESKIKELKINELTGDLRDVPAPFSTKDLGTELLQQRIPIIKIPSIVIKDEFNYLINPLAGNDFFKLVDVSDFIYDLRIKNKPN